MTQQRLGETDAEYEARKKRVSAVHRSSNFNLAIVGGGAILSKEGSSTLKINPFMTSDTLPEGLCFGSSKIAGREYWHGFATLVSNLTWITNTVPNGFIGYKFTAAKAVNKYQIYPDGFDLNRAGKDWVFEGSNDSTNGTDGTWDTLDTQTGISDWSVDTLKEFTFSNTAEYLYYRVNCSANNGAAYYSLRGLYLFESIIV